MDRNRTDTNDTLPSAEAQEYAISHYYGRFFFDVSWFILINTILLQIVFGIIVDTFANIREDRNEKIQDQLSNCFICGLPASTLNFNGNGFRHHTKNEHNMFVVDGPPWCHCMHKLTDVSCKRFLNMCNVTKTMIRILVQVGLFQLLRLSSAEAAEQVQHH